MGNEALCSLCMAFNASSSGVSMPTNTASKRAWRIIARISGCFAMFSVASQANETGYPCLFCHATKCGNISRVALRLPMKLSSREAQAGGCVFLRKNEIQLPNQLLRRFHGWLPAIKVRNIAELAQI